MEKPSLRASMVAMLLPCTYSIGGAALAVDFFDSDKLCDVVAAERLGAGGFLQNVLHQRVGLFGQHLQLDGLQGDRLPALRIGGLIDRANLGMRNFAEYFETSDLVGHCSLSPDKSTNRRSFGKTPEVVLGGKVRTRISRLNRGWELRRYSEMDGTSM